MSHLFYITFDRFFTKKKTKKSAGVTRAQRILQGKLFVFFLIARNPEILVRCLSSSAVSTVSHQELKTWSASGYKPEITKGENSTMYECECRTTKIFRNKKFTDQWEALIRSRLSQHLLLHSITHLDDTRGLRLAVATKTRGFLIAKSWRVDYTYSVFICDLDHASSNLINHHKIEMSSS